MFNKKKETRDLLAAKVVMNDELQNSLVELIPGLADMDKDSRIITIASGVKLLNIERCTLMKAYRMIWEASPIVSE